MTYDQVFRYFDVNKVRCLNVAQQRVEFFEADDLEYIGAVNNGSSVTVNYRAYYDYWESR